MEELGIGRPSTYAPTITTIIARRYVAKENKNLYMTELGEVVNQMTKEAFPSIVDVNFTATMEDLLDKVGDGTVDWKVVVRNFYPDLDESVKEAEKNLEEVKLEDEVTDVICENCGRNMVIKYGPHGRFLHVPDFRIAEIPSRIWKRSVSNARSVEKKWFFAKPRKAGNITAARIIRNVISCPGQNRSMKSVRNAAVTW